MGITLRNLFGSVAIVNAISGICVPGLPLKYKNYYNLMMLYCLFAQIVCNSQSVACILIIWDYSHAKNVVHVASILALYLGSSFWCLYLIFKRKDFNKIMERFDHVIECFNSESFNTNFDLIKTYQPTKKFIVTIFFSFAVLPVVNNTQKLLASWRFFGLDGTKSFNYQVPYDATSSPVYEITILLQATGLFWACTAQGCSIHLFSSFYFILSIFFKRLQDTISCSVQCDNTTTTNKATGCVDIVNLNSSTVCSSVKKSTEELTSPKVLREDLVTSKMENTELLKNWIEIHQEVLSISKELIRMYSPLLAVYFVYIYISVAFTMFSAVQNTHSHTPIEIVVLAYFSLLTLVNFYMLCSYGHFIMVESEKVSWAVYSAPWCDSTQQHKSVIKMILLRSADPTIVNCFSSTAFDLTHSTFIVIMKSIVSFYLGLVQMRKQ